MTKIETLLQRIADAEDALLAELERTYPVGCEVEYRLRDGVPTKFGNVTKHIGGRDGELRVLLAPNPRAVTDRASRYETTLPVRKIIRRVK